MEIRLGLTPVQKNLLTNHNTSEASTLKSNIEVKGMYTLKLSPSERKSPGRRPIQFNLS